MAERRPEDAFHDLVTLTRQLRSPEGCAWDRAQTIESIRPHLVEEFHELLDALDIRDDHMIADELGDLFFLILFIAEIADEDGRFHMLGVIDGIHDKLRRRHPHVFGTAAAFTPDEVRTTWERGKLSEATHSRRESLLDGLPRGFPALLAARRIQDKASAVGFDWPDASGVLAKVAEEMGELRAEIEGRDAEGSDDVPTAAHSERAEQHPHDEQDNRCEQELGDLLFAIVNLSRFLGADPEAALRRANLRFRRRFALIEERFAGRDLKEVGLEEMDRVWNEAKLMEEET